MWAAGGGRRQGRLLRSALFLAAALLLLGGWVSYIYNAFGFLAPTTMGGYNLVQHAGVFFEYLPEEDAVLRDTYLEYRDARIAERGDQTNTIWEAIPELTEVSGLGFYDLSREMQRLSLKLIRAHPDLYLRNVAEGWVDFWKAPVYWDPAQAASPAVADVLRPWAAAGRALMLAANAAFLLLERVGDPSLPAVRGPAARSPVAGPVGLHLVYVGRAGIRRSRGQSSLSDTLAGRCLLCRGRRRGRDLAA